MGNIEALRKAIDKLFKEYNKVKDTSSFTEFNEFANNLRKVAIKYEITILDEIAKKIVKEEPYANPE